MVMCSRCGADKPSGDFGPDKKKLNGLFSWCRACCAAQARARYTADPEKHRQQVQEFRKRTGYAIEYAREYRARNHERCLESNRIWREENRQRIREYDAMQRDTDKVRARMAVRLAIKAGKLKVQPCERCGYGVGVHAHHEDYSKPLEVIWLCRRHHGERHREINEERRRQAA